MAYAQETFVEYKKFLWLAKTTRCRVVSSKPVDKVWHLHMTFTQSYWNELCGDVLGFELHHSPSSETIESKQADLDSYENTLQLYKTEFGEQPCNRYWPRPKYPRSDGLSRIA